MNEYGKSSFEVDDATAAGKISPCVAMTELFVVCCDEDELFPKGRLREVGKINEVGRCLRAPSGLPEDPNFAATGDPVVRNMELETEADG